MPGAVPRDRWLDGAWTDPRDVRRPPGHLSSGPREVLPMG